MKTAVVRSIQRAGFVSTLCGNGGHGRRPLIQMVLARGVDAVSVEAVAARAGVSKATFYKHFAHKQALFEAAVLREMERIGAAQGIAKALNRRL